MSLQRLAISVSTAAIVFRLAAFKATAFGSKLSRASVKRRLIASGSDHDYGNWSKKAPVLHVFVATRIGATKTGPFVPLKELSVSRLSLLPDQVLNDSAYRDAAPSCPGDC